ncbi:hypothetical protein [Phaffia rhodozyma]|uniref:Uncharacterized protein n=1 Tax=Phaffia rhodozyma TaxID=264483 RepID=A0A0F7ST26_PHARH|nr:hypothetical protein [Phaffia rhodozyma]
MTNPLQSLFDAVVSVFRAVYDTFYAVCHTIFSVLENATILVWNIVTGILKTTFNVSEATLEGVAKLFVDGLELLWNNKLVIGAIALVLVVLQSRTAQKTAGNIKQKAKSA